jgi:dGTPase
MTIAPWAAHESTSRGRRHAETRPIGRSEFQRDRDRIIHCAAFRRLEYKTQVFLNHEGDWFRTRLTHSIEVAQIARTIARNLGLEEDLTEAIALAHDLGHTPFGHAGQDALNICMAQAGGFEHNIQSLRVVDELERRYAAFDGLNLLFETREGILKHCNPTFAQALGEVAERFLKGGQPSLEAQLTNLADELAYTNHDIDDGLRSGLIHFDELCQFPLFAVHAQEVKSIYGKLDEERLRCETIRRIINCLVMDLMETSRSNIARSEIASIEDVRNTNPLVCFSTAMQQDLQALKSYLLNNLYRHPNVLRMARKAKAIVRELFSAFSEEPSLLPIFWKSEYDRRGLRAIADYIASLTDRSAVSIYQAIFTTADKARDIFS